MSTGELRRGPGWWMDLNGIWNPPELWPEENPPLPDWHRNDDGTWLAPDDVPHVGQPEDNLAAGPTPEPVVSLEYMSYEPAPSVDDSVELRKAASAALIAAIIAGMVACGLVVLLLLF